MTWGDELAAILAQAHGRLDMFLALVALRTVENGGAGKEFGVLSEDAPTYQAQCKVACVSFQNAELRLAEKVPIRHPETGLFTDDFLRGFSARWAPLGVSNDPHNLNVNHAANLVAVYHRLSTPVLQALLTLPPHGD